MIRAGSGWTMVVALGCVMELAGAHAYGALQTEHAKKAKTTHHAVGTHGTTSREKEVSARGAHAKLRSATATRVTGKRTERRVVSHAGPHSVVVKATPESKRLSVAFVATANLRPMAQALVMTRSSAAYSGVLAYAASHPGVQAATANLALGHAYMLDRRFGDAEGAFRQSAMKSSELSDYADYLGAQAALQGGHPNEALPLLDHFADRHPGSLFVHSAAVLQANAMVAAGDTAGAVKLLTALQGTQEANHVDYRYALAKAYQANANTAQAATLYRGIYLGDPLSPEAVGAKTQLASMNVPLTVAERKQHADAMFNAKQYTDAANEYRGLKKEANGLSQADKDALEIYAAVCDLKLKKLSKGDVDHLPVTGDDSAALKLYLQSELARNEGKADQHDEIVKQLTERYPQSRWLEEALYSGGNMYLLKHDSEHAIADYVALTEHFPRSTYAPNAHWHAAWLNYRLRRYPEAAKLMDEQITSYPAGSEIPGALYWRGRLYEDVEHNFAQAVNYYKALDAAYVNSYYAMLGRQRMAVIGSNATVAPAPALASVRMLEDPGLTADLPENDPHLIKARLLANAALNEYIRPEIQLSETSGQWGAFAEAEIYESFGETTRALQAMKRSRIPFFSLSVQQVPMQYWQMVFPRPYWDQLTEDAKSEGLDPFLVASLIRQESEFNPTAVSRANAYGLMQLLPSTGKMLAKKDGDKHFSTGELLNPTVNLKLGTMDLKRSIDKYNGEVAYALAAYNAGDTPVHNWIALNDYKDVAEWVESIPYTETREYVQGILRNREVYRAVYSGTERAGK